jgi:hypothetical protein
MRFGIWFGALLFAVVSIPAPSASAAEPPNAARLELKQDDGQGTLQVLLDGKEAFVYQYGHVDMPHLYPVHSPSGKLLTIQKTDPYPPHRSVWFGDTVQLEGQRQTSFYQPLYSQVDKKDPQSPYRDRIRHVKFLAAEVADGRANLGMQLLWEADLGNLPVMDDVREIRVVPLGNGEYFLDCRFTVTAAYGDVTFRSDQAHYAWPYIRIQPQFSGQQGGTITNSEGATGEPKTLMQPARWVDYSNTVEGASEGLTIFANPQEPPPKFFTRAYGTFGPRRPDDKSGKPFVLKQGESLSQRIGLLIHTGDVQSGRVADRYQQFAEGKL